MSRRFLIGQVLACAVVGTGCGGDSKGVPSSLADAALRLDGADASLAPEAPRSVDALEAPSSQDATPAFDGTDGPGQRDSALAVDTADAPRGDVARAVDAADAPAVDVADALPSQDGGPAAVDAADTSPSQDAGRAADVGRPRCVATTDCESGDYCDLGAATPVCRPLPTGQGTACSRSADCAGFEASYCETMVSETCLVRDCTPALNNCSDDYRCCDLAPLGMPALCLPRRLLGTGATCP